MYACVRAKDETRRLFSRFFFPFHRCSSIGAWPNGNPHLPSLIRTGSQPFKKGRERKYHTRFIRLTGGDSFPHCKGKENRRTAALTAERREAGKVRRGELKETRTGGRRWESICAVVSPRPRAAQATPCRERRLTPSCPRSAFLFSLRRLSLLRNDARFCLPAKRSRKNKKTRSGRPATE
ncbi:hypothetical protein BDY21DRAFT_6830 [Lineolata rhizophorae]|uniref:Uncharacterized protein n=1 Tax=Lineolata rhizophorae TaxID=578093 RepID=A0A6A6PDL3_9PEZI|nr:hypothetical protein BDY21DRAFT_6830 [Lineolata rhizophorae]